MLIIANWKANLVDSSSFNIFGGDGVEVAIAAPFPQLQASAQDVSMFPPGAYTGEVPAELLRNHGVKYCLIGHSERRKYLGETTEMVGRKMERLLENGIKPVICAQKFEEIPENAGNVAGNEYLVMFEPFEAISQDGKYNPVPVEKIKETLVLWKNKLPEGVKFLYGGSVNLENAKQISEIAEVSGFVVGHAALNAEEFQKLVEQCTPRANS